MFFWNITSAIVLLGALYFPTNSDLLFSSETKMLTWTIGNFSQMLPKFIVENFMVRLFFLNSFRSILFSLKFCDKVLLTQKYPMNPGKQVKKKKNYIQTQGWKTTLSTIFDCHWKSTVGLIGTKTSSLFHHHIASHHITLLELVSANTILWGTIFINIHAMTFYCVSRTLKMMWASLLHVDDVMIQSDNTH
jgi:hypothetical protein